jgi:hypothetical protein
MIKDLEILSNPTVSCYCEKALRKTEYPKVDGRPVYKCFVCGRLYVLGDKQIEEVKFDKDKVLALNGYVRHVKATDL